MSNSETGLIRNCLELQSSISWSCVWRVRLLVAWGWQDGKCRVFVTLCTAAGGGEHQVKTKQKKVLGLAEWLRKAAVKVHFSGCVGYTSMVGNCLLGPFFLSANRIALFCFSSYEQLCKKKNGLFVSFWGYNCSVHDSLWLFSSRTTHRHVKYQRDTELLSCSQVPLAALQGLSLEEQTVWRGS